MRPHSAYESWSSQRRQERKLSLLRDINAKAGGNAGSHCMVLQDPEIPWSLRHIPMGHHNPDAAALVEELLALV